MPIAEAQFGVESQSNIDFVGSGGEREAEMDADRKL
jgi:hypothetical protein